MQALEVRIPPPVAGLLVAGAMWGISRLAPLVDFPASARIAAAVAFALAGISFSVAGVISFRIAKTTVNAMQLEKTSALVRSGIYRISRNPIYVGLTLVLVAWAVFLSSAWALLGPLAFALYMNRFQIVPEERALATMFGADFTAYQSRVRRWL